MSIARAPWPGWWAKVRLCLYSVCVVSVHCHFWIEDGCLVRPISLYVCVGLYVILPSHNYVLLILLIKATSDKYECNLLVVTVRHLCSSFFHWSFRSTIIIYMVYRWWRHMSSSSALTFMRNLFASSSSDNPFSIKSCCVLSVTFDSVFLSFSSSPHPSPTPFYLFFFSK